VEAVFFTIADDEVSVAERHNGIESELEIFIPYLLLKKQLTFSFYFGLKWLHVTSFLQLDYQYELENAFPAENVVSTVVQSEVENIFLIKPHQLNINKR
jgi:hypothetical protein